MWRRKGLYIYFIPNKGYYVSKVYVDGKQVNVKDNKYTFKSVEKNHTISVTFGKTRLGIPQTGDDINLTLIWGLSLCQAAWSSFSSLNAGNAENKKKIETVIE